MSPSFFGTFLVRVSRGTTHSSCPPQFIRTPVRVFSGFCSLLLPSHTCFWGKGEAGEYRGLSGKCVRVAGNWRKSHGILNKLPSCSPRPAGPCSLDQGSMLAHPPYPAAGGRTPRRRGRARPRPGAVSAPPCRTPPPVWSRQPPPWAVCRPGDTEVPRHHPGSRLYTHRPGAALWGLGLQSASAERRACGDALVTRTVRTAH